MEHIGSVRLILEALAGGAAIGHAAAASVITSGLLKKTERDVEQLPTVTIVVPARNEARNLPRLLLSFQQLDYPSDLLDLVIVNDASTDDTRAIAEQLASSLPFRVTIVDASHDSSETLPATKTLPLAQGLDVAQGEFVLMTDGDCVVPRDWVRGLIAEFGEGVGMVCGMTLPDHSEGNYITKLEAVDWGLLLGVCCSMTRLGVPLALIGNNYAVRRLAYQDIGTFRQIKFNRIDDIALFRAVAESQRWRIAFALSPRSMNTTLPSGGFFDILKQRYRWLEGFSAVSLQGKSLFAFGMFTHLFWPLAFAFGLPIGLFCASGVVLGDWLVLISTLSRLKQRGLAAATITYPLFTFLYGWALLGMIIARPEIRWRGRKLT